MNRIAVIINPVSGGGKGHKVWQVLSPGLRALFNEIDYRISNHADDLVSLTRTLLEKKPDYLVVIGGDGTLSHVVNGALDEDEWVSPETQLAFFNAGCGGDYIRQFPMQHVTDFLEHLKTRRSYLTNVGKIRFSDGSFRYFVNIASCGLSAFVAKETQQSKWFKKLGGSVNYFAHSISGLMRYHPQPVEIRIDDNAPFQCKLLMMAVCNGPYFGGKMHVAPLAKIDDDLFDIVIFHDLNMISALWKLRKIYTGSHLHEKSVHYIQGKRIQISSLNQIPISVEADGEVVGQIPVSFDLLNKKMELIV